MIGHDDDARGWPQRVRVFDTPAPHPATRHQPGEVHHEDLVPKDGQWTKITKDKVGYAEPKAFDSTQSTELFFGWLNHVWFTVGGGLSLYPAWCGLVRG